MGLDLLDVDAKNMLMYMAEYSFQDTRKKRKTFWDNSRLPQSIIIARIKISFGYTEKGILFHKVFKWFIFLTCKTSHLSQITHGLTRGNPENIMLSLYRRYFPQIQMALKWKYLEISRNHQKAFSYLCWRKSECQDCNQQFRSRKKSCNM